MFRIILLLFIYIQFSSNFFYSFLISYIPFKNAQTVNIYNSYKVFEDPRFTTFMNTNTLTGTTFSVNWVWNIALSKITFWQYSGVVLKLPYKVNHRFWEQLEILIPILPDAWTIAKNDTNFNKINYIYKQQIIKNGVSYLDFWINYNQITNQNQLTNRTIENLKLLYLNKFYIISSWITNNVVKKKKKKKKKTWVYLVR